MTYEKRKELSKIAQDSFERNTGKYLNYPLEKFENGEYVNPYTCLALKVYVEGYIHGVEDTSNDA